MRSFFLSLVFCALFLSACKKKKPAETPADSCSCTYLEKEKAVREQRADAIQKMLDTCVQNTVKGPVQAEAPTEDPSATKIRSGAMYMLERGDTVEVMNPDHIQNPAWHFPHGSLCRVDPKAKVQIIGSYVDKEMGAVYLVRYFPEPVPQPRTACPIQEEPAPRECPEQTNFFIDDLSMMAEVKPDLRGDIAKKLLNSEKP